MKYTGILDQTFRYIEDFQLTDKALWARFVDQFKIHTDTEFGWRGEYWGKMMRGACLVYSYTQNPKLLEILTQTVQDMMTAADEDGCISSCPKERHFTAWDLWCRKYVLLGMEYFLEINQDPTLEKKIIASMERQMAHIMAHIGPKEEGKLPITKATHHWRGLNSSSLLEPVVRLYNWTKKKEYFDFATYIVDNGFTDVENIHGLALADELMPYQYPVTKAYEMTSCFEGLLEYYYITGEEKYKTAIQRFADRVLETDFTVIGCAGCTHELFDHSAVRQANTTNGNIMQETCVTVTLMKFFARVHQLTGDSKYIDAFERALYNAYLGTINTEKVIEPMIKRDHPDWVAESLPFDSYSPLTAGTRGNGIGGLRIMPDNHYYGCCACIGAAGIGMVPQAQFAKGEDFIALNLFIDGSFETTTPAGAPLVVQTQTQYPKDGAVAITLSMAQSEEFILKIRNPRWSKQTKAKVNGQPIAATPDYIEIQKIWQDGDTIELELDMRVFAIRPIPYGTQILMNKVVWGANSCVPTFDREDPIAHKHIAYQRGPLMLAQENRLGYSVDDPIAPLVNEDGTVNAQLSEKKKAPYPTLLERESPFKDGTSQLVTDYASAGKLWTEESKMAVWLLTE
ncbi:MAG: glycoside hydrolase family 127 protein [Clostridia bacterium]|nr:glycoside hydrolase family 127 protein [Clostridia bacterium]